MTVQSNIKSALAAVAVALLASCSTLESGIQHLPMHQEDFQDPWTTVQAGDTSLGFSSGWAFYGAEVEAEGTGGVLNGDVGTDDASLTPRYGGALKLNHYFTDNFSLGLIYEHRNFDVDPVSPLSATLVADPFSTDHFLLSSRYWAAPMGNQKRWRPFVGLDVGYIPEVDFGSVAVNYPASAPWPNESVNIVGSEYWTLGVVGGASYMLKPGLSLDMGAFYEWAITPGEDTLQLANPPGGGTADVEVWPGGLIVFGGLTWYF